MLIVFQALTIAVKSCDIIPDLRVLSQVFSLNSWKLYWQRFQCHHL